MHSKTVSYQEGPGGPARHRVLAHLCALAGSDLVVLSNTAQVLLRGAEGRLPAGSKCSTWSCRPVSQDFVITSHAHCPARLPCPNLRFHLHYIPAVSHTHAHTHTLSSPSPPTPRLTDRRSHTQPYAKIGAKCTSSKASAEGDRSIRII